MLILLLHIFISLPNPIIGLSIIYIAVKANSFAMFFTTEQLAVKPTCFIMSKAFATQSR